MSRDFIANPVLLLDVKETGQHVTSRAPSIVVLKDGRGAAAPRCGRTGYLYRRAGSSGGPPEFSLTLAFKTIVGAGAVFLR